MFPHHIPKRLLHRDPIWPAPPPPEEDTGFNSLTTFGVWPTTLMTLVISLLGSPTPTTMAEGGILGSVVPLGHYAWILHVWQANREFCNSESILKQCIDRVSPLRFFCPEWRLHSGRAAVLHLPQQPAEPQLGVSGTSTHSNTPIRTGTGTIPVLKRAKYFSIAKKSLRNWF
jgi:hypothetical protein